MLGASGAVMGIMVLYVLHFPRRMIYIWGVLPVPAWVLAIIYVGSDFLGFVGPADRGDGPRVAYETHLAGTALAAIYFYSHINLGQLLPSGGLKNWRPRPRFARARSALQRACVARRPRRCAVGQGFAQGIDSLSPSEHKMLEDASKRYQRRRS